MEIFLNFNDELKQIEQAFDIDKDNNYTYLQGYFEKLEGNIIDQEKSNIDNTFLLFSEAVNKKVFDFNKRKNTLLVNKLLLEFDYLQCDLTTIESTCIFENIKHIRTINLEQVDIISLDLISFTLDTLIDYRRNITLKSKTDLTILNKLQNFLNKMIENPDFNQLLLKKVNILNNLFKTNIKKNRDYYAYYKELNSLISFFVMNSKNIDDKYSITILYLMEKTIFTEDDVVLFLSMILKHKEHTLGVDNEIIMKIRDNFISSIRDFEHSAINKKLEQKEYNEKLEKILLELL